MDSLQGGQEGVFAGWCCAGLLWAPSTGPFGESSTRVCVRFRTFSAGYSLVVQSTVDSSGNAVAATWPFVLAFFLWLSLWRSSHNPPSLSTGLGVRTKQNPNPAVMESKAVLFTTQQPSKWGDELRHRAATLLRKPADGDKAGPRVPKSVLPA